MVAECEAVLMVRVGAAAPGPHDFLPPFAPQIEISHTNFPQSSIKRRLRDLVEGAETGEGGTTGGDAPNDHRPPRAAEGGEPVQVNAVGPGAAGEDTTFSHAGAAHARSAPPRHGTAPPRAPAVDNGEAVGTDRGAACNQAGEGGAGAAANPWQRAPKQKRHMAREFDPSRWLGRVPDEGGSGADEDAGPDPASPAADAATVSLSQEEAELRRQAAALRAAEARLERKKRQARLREVAERLCRQAQSQCEAAEARVRCPQGEPRRQGPCTGRGG